MIISLNTFNKADSSLLKRIHFTISKGNFWLIITSASSAHRSNILKWYMVESISVSYKTFKGLLLFSWCACLQKGKNGGLYSQKQHRKTKQAMISNYMQPLCWKWDMIFYLVIYVPSLEFGQVCDCSGSVAIYLCLRLDHKKGEASICLSLNCSVLESSNYTLGKPKKTQREATWRCPG